MHVIILRGVSGAGKSTARKALVPADKVRQSAHALVAEEKNFPKFLRDIHHKLKY